MNGTKPGLLIRIGEDLYRRPKPNEEHLYPPACEEAASGDVKKKIKKLKIKSIKDVYKSSDFLVSFSPQLISANNQIREFLKLNMYENKSVKKMTNKAEIIIKKLYIYLIKNNKKFILPDLKKKWGLERSVSDFIAGMTDKFAIDLYNKIK